MESKISAVWRTTGRIEGERRPQDRCFPVRPLDHTAFVLFGPGRFTLSPGVSVPSPFSV
jgi:hypothetical protein